MGSKGRGIASALQAGLGHRAAPLVAVLLCVAVPSLASEVWLRTALGAAAAVAATIAIRHHVRSRVGTVLARVDTLQRSLSERLDGDLMVSMPDYDEEAFQRLGHLIEQLLSLADGPEKGLQSMQIAMLVLSPDARIEVTNQAAVQLFGYDNRGELALESVRVLLPSDEDLRWLVDGADGPSAARRETIALRADGSGFHVELKVAERSDERIVIHCTDTTAQHELNDAMQRARDTALHTAELQAQFLANMSHEIRTPVNGILGMAQLLLESGELTGESLESAEVIHSCGKTLLSIINDILDLSKLDAGKVTLEPRETNLRQLTREAVTLLGPKADERGNAVELDFPFHPSLPRHAIVDAVRLRQILLNLLSNAVKFTSNGSVCLRVRFRSEGEAAERGTFVFEVEDTGVGIPQEKIGQIFERFVQAEASTTRKFGGTGLGLSITRQLTELMGGSISVESCDQGTLFRVEMRLELCGAGDSRGLASSIPAERSMEGLRVLVAEDNPVNQMIARRMLTKMGCTVHVVDNGGDAARAALSGEYEVVLMDCMMPEVDGYEGTRRIREAEARNGGHIPVIALTARAMSGDQERCMAAGMDGYLTKPFSVAGLQGAMGRGLASTESSPAAAG